MKKTIVVILAVILATTALFTLSGCEYHNDTSDKWKTKYDITAPVLADAGASKDSANSGGWYSTMLEDFTSISAYRKWGTSPHGLRKTEYWCDDLVTMKDGNMEITAIKSDTHNCKSGKCPQSGYFTSGIETRKLIGDQYMPSFEQAFGYFEARVKFPNSAGLWSAFWLQSTSQGQLGNKGKDGAEIDIYESSFWSNRTKVGHCIHYDGYGKEHKGGQSVRDTGKDLYDGYHTFALKWTPSEYVFYVDGVATWATNFGGVSQVPAYVRLTNEIRSGKTGPYGQALGTMVDNSVFYVDYVKVYQNTNYLSSIKSPADFL